MSNDELQLNRDEDDSMSDDDQYFEDLEPTIKHGDIELQFADDPPKVKPNVIKVDLEQCK